MKGWDVPYKKGSGSDESFSFLKFRDPRYKEIYSGLIQVDKSLPVPKEKKNPQMAFGFLDLSYPVLRRKIDPDQDAVSGKPELENEVAIVLGKIAYALFHRIEKILSPETRSGERFVLPIEHLHERKVLEGLKILDISSDERAACRIKEFGAEVDLLSPYENKIPIARREPSDEERSEWSKKFVGVVGEATQEGKHELVFADRSTLYWTFAANRDAGFSYVSKETEEIIQAVNKELYRKVAGLCTEWHMMPDTAVEVFQKKNK